MIMYICQLKKVDKQVGTLAVSPTEYVVDSYTMAALGDGNPEEGAKLWIKQLNKLEKKHLVIQNNLNEIDGLAALRPMAQGV